MGQLMRTESGKEEISGKRREGARLSQHLAGKKTEPVRSHPRAEDRLRGLSALL